MKDNSNSACQNTDCHPGRDTCKPSGRLLILVTHSLQDFPSLKVDLNYNLLKSHIHCLSTPLVSWAMAYVLALDCHLKKLPVTLLSPKGVGC